MPKDDSKCDSDSDSYNWNEELIDTVRKPLTTLTEEDRIKQMQGCLMNGADVDAIDKNENTALHIAVKKGYIKIVRFLRERRARTNLPNKKGYTAMELAEAPGKEEILKALEEVPDRCNQSSSPQIACSSQARNSRKRAAEADYVDKENYKKRPCCTVEEEEEGISIFEDPKLEDDTIDDEIEVRQQTLRPNGNDRHSASGLKDTLHGVVYQLKLLMFFLWRGLQNGYSFHLATEMTAAEKFDDLVFHYENQTGIGTVYRFLQAKHKQNEKEKISANDLLTENDDAFSLQKYFSSYRKMKKDSKLKESESEDFIICTNIDFDFEGLESKRISLVGVRGSDAFLDIKYTTKQPGRYKLLVDRESKLYEVLERSADVYKLAKKLVEYVFESKDITLKNDFFKLYHVALANEVIDVENKRFSGNFIEGEILSERGKNFWTIFREIFSAEALKKFKKSLEKNFTGDPSWNSIPQFKSSIDLTLNTPREVSQEESDLYEILEQTSDLHVLAKILVEYVFESKDITSWINFFKLHHPELAEEVIDIQNKRFNGKFVEGKKLSESGIKFREIFYVEVLWKQKTREPLKLSSTFGKKFELITDPILEPLDEFSEELVELINSADNDNLVTVDGRKYRKNAKAGSREKIFVDNIDKLVGHVLITEDQKIKFRSQFFDDNTKLPGNLEDLKNSLKTQLGSKYEDLNRYQFKITNFKTCEENQLYSKTELPVADVDSEEIYEFFEKLIFAVNQPDEVELGDTITREIADHSRFNLLNADLVGSSFQKEMLDWFKEKGKEKGREGRFYSAEEGKVFFASAEQKLDVLTTSGLSLAYPEELAEYGMEFETENVDLRNFLTLDSGREAKRALNVIAAQETLPSAIRVHRAIQQTGRYNEYDSLIFLRLRTFLLPGIMRRVINAFKSKDSHKLLVIDCESSEHQVLRRLYRQLYLMMEESNGKKIIIVTLGNKTPENPSSIRFENCDKICDDVSFNDLTTKSRDQLMTKQIVNFQGDRGSTSLGRLLGIRSCDDVVSRKLINSRGLIDTSMLVKLIRNEEVTVGSELHKTPQYYVHRKINRPVVIKNEILKFQSISDLLAISAADGESLKKLTKRKKVLYYDFDPNEQYSNEFISLDPGLEDHQFKMLCEKSSKNVHWLNIVRGKLLWQRSKDDITSLMQYRDLSETSDSRDYGVDKPIAGCLTDDDELVEHVNRPKVLIISDSAGMGKTTVLAYLAEKMKPNEPELWVINVDLKDFTTALDEELRSRSFDAYNTDGAVKFFVEKLVNPKTELEKNLLTTMIKNRGRVALLFDSFDEISPDYQNVVLDLLQVFKTIRVSGLFVATRPTMREPLENTLGLLSSTMEPFSHEDQIECMLGIWRAGLIEKGVKQSNEVRMRIYAEALSEKLVQSINYTITHLVSIPLQTWMIAKLFQDDTARKLGKRDLQTCEEFLSSKNDYPKLPEKMKIVDLYESFVHMTYYRYIEQKLEHILTRPAEQEDSEESYKIFKRKYERLALHALFGNEMIPLNQQELQCLNAHVIKINEGRERIGIAEINEGKLQFIHRTFAEYFVAMFISNILLEDTDDNPEVKRFIIEKILCDLNCTVIRAFLNGMLSEEASGYVLQSAADESVTKGWINSLWKSYAEMGCSIFRNLAEEGHYEILKIFLNRFNDEGLQELMFMMDEDEVYSTTVLDITAENKHWDELKWLVEKGDELILAPLICEGTLLHVAASEGNSDIVEWLIQKGASANALDDEGRTPLHEAARFGHLAVLKLLVENEGDINLQTYFGHTVLYYAASTGKLNVVEWLVGVRNADLNPTSSHGKTALHSAASRGRWDVVKWLIMNTEDGVDITTTSQNGNTVLHEAAFQEYWDMVKWLVENKNANVRVKNSKGISVLHEVVCEGPRDLVNWLWERKCIDVNDFDEGKLLCHAAYDQRWDTVKWLVEVGGVNVNIRSDGGGTILHYATSANNPELVKWLVVERGADTNIQDNNGITILHCAGDIGQLELLKWLVQDIGADVNIQEICGRTVLHRAADVGHLELVKWLVEDVAAKVDIRDKDGWTILHHAATNGHFELVKWLVDERGLDINIKAHSGLTLLHLAASSGVKPLVNWLLEEKSLDIGARTQKGETVLQSAALARRWDLVKWLVEEKGIQSDGMVELLKAIDLGDLDAIKCHVNDGGIDLHTEYEVENIILHYAFISGHLEVIKWLVSEKGVDIVKPDRRGFTLLDSLPKKSIGVHTMMQTFPGAFGDIECDSYDHIEGYESDEFEN